MKSLYTFIIVAVFAAMPFGPAQAEQNPRTVDGVQITDLHIGEGEEAKPGMYVQMAYTGWTLDGKMFDTSKNHAAPFTFQLGAGSVIKGWDIGVAGMRIGGKRELVIPGNLAYGKRGFPPKIPPNATLKFEVELVAFPGPPYADISNDELKDLLARGVPIVDLRRAEEWKQTGVVEGSHLITAFDGRGRFMGGFLNTFEKVAGPNDEVILICRTGNRTSTIARALSMQVGYTKVYNVKNGITKWIADGNPVVKP